MQAAAPQGSGDLGDPMSVLCPVRGSAQGPGQGELRTRLFVGTGDLCQAIKLTQRPGGRMGISPLRGRSRGRPSARGLRASIPTVPWPGSSTGSVCPRLASNKIFTLVPAGWSGAEAVPPSVTAWAGAGGQRAAGSAWPVTRPLFVRAAARCVCRVTLAVALCWGQPGLLLLAQGR